MTQHELDEQAARWQSRIKNATEDYNVWANEFRTDENERYYEGKQWRQTTVNPRYVPYTLNLIQSTIRTKLASLIFQKPSFSVTPRPGNSDWNQEEAIKSAQLKQDTLNTIIQNPAADFVSTAKDIGLDSFLRFAIMEVDYASDWRNPLKLSPVVDDEEDEKPKVEFEQEVPENGRVYFKRIDPTHFRCASGPAKYLNRKAWVGYYEDYYESDLRAIKELKWPKDYRDSSSFSTDFQSKLVDNVNGEKLSLKDGKTICVWHIWDSSAGKRRMLMDKSCFEMWSEDFERLPLVDLRWITRTKGFYPIPPVTSWLCSQDEINESREQMRSYRRRFTRKFKIIGDVDPVEITKFESGPDGALIKLNPNEDIQGIDNPALPQVVTEMSLIGKDDFQIVAGVSSEVRGNVDRETATASTIKNQRLQVIENSEQLDFSAFFTAVGRLALITAQEKMEGRLWVAYSQDPGTAPTVLQDAQVLQNTYKMISAQDLHDGYDFLVDIDILNATPAAMAQSQESFVKFVTMVSQFPMLAISPVLIRETAYRVGYRNEKVIADMQQAAILSMAAKAAAANGGTLSQGDGGQNANNTAAAQMATPGSTEIANQLTQQLQ